MDTNAVAASNRSEMLPDFEALKFLSVNQALIYMNISHAHLYRLLSKNAFDAHKVGNKTLIKKASIDEYLEKNRYSVVGSLHHMSKENRALRRALGKAKVGSKAPPKKRAK